MKEFFKKYLKRFLTPSQYNAFSKSLFIRLLRAFLSGIYSDNLNMLATINSCDKWNLHWYTQHYMKHFHSLRKKRLNILEIGVGGYADPNRGGESLKMWKYYFPNSMIYSIDIYEKNLPKDKRIKIFKGSQTDEAFLKDAFNRMGSLDIVIDDGSHQNEDIITTFKILFPLLNNGGIYAIEDIQFSYWPEYGGDRKNLNNPKTVMNFFKNLTDCLNHAEFTEPGDTPSYFDKNIIAVHFYHNLIIVSKGVNDEKRITM